MKFVQVNMLYFEEALEIAFETYKKECKYVMGIELATKEDISRYLKVIFERQNGKLCIDDDKLVGYLVYQEQWEEDELMCYRFPLWGYGAVGKARTKIISMLFQVLAEELCTGPRTHFEIQIYAHDHEIIQLFSFLQFGIQCEEGICNCKVPDTNLNHVNVRELTKKEKREQWDLIWRLLKELINHLRKSPVFYPGIEFTEELYQSYLCEEDTRLFVAEVDQKIIGIISTNKGGNSFVNDQADCYNVGDIYVIPEYRGKMVAQTMLNGLFDVLAQEGVHRVWVEHGTANPNARGFWNKYFDSYSYTMIRNISVR